MSDQSPASSAGPERVTVEVPSMPIDAVQVVPTPFTIHLNVGTSLPDGRVIPRAHLAIGIDFARHLHARLGEAIAWAEARQSGAAASGPNAAPGAGLPGAAPPGDKVPGLK